MTCDARQNVSHFPPKSPLLRITAECRDGDGDGDGDGEGDGDFRRVAAAWNIDQNGACISRRRLVPILDKPAFSRIPLNSEPRIVVEIFGKFVKRQVCPKWD